MSNICDKVKEQILYILYDTLNRYGKIKTMDLVRECKKHDLTITERQVRYILKQEKKRRVLVTVPDLLDIRSYYHCLNTPDTPAFFAEPKKQEAKT